MSARKGGEQRQAHMQRLAEKLGFNDENSKLLQQALTHPTYAEGSRLGKGNNQRLEFLGDAVLDLLVGEYLFHSYPKAQEGELSKMRAFIVRESSIAEAAVTLGIDQALLLGHGADSSGDRERPSVQADAFEAVLGALFLSQGVEKVRELLSELFAPIMDKLTSEDYEDKKSMLQELVQSKVPYGVNYKLQRLSGPDHCPNFEAHVYCGKVLLGKGQGHSKKESESAAAAVALKNKDKWLNKILSTTDE